MLHLLLAVVIISALSLLALSSFRLGQRAMAAALAVAAVLMSTLVGWAIVQQDRQAPTLDASQLQVELGAMHVTANGWRIEGQVRNLGDKDVSAMTLAAIALDCDARQTCAPLWRGEFDLLMNVPAGKSYPLRYALDAPPLTAEGELRWQLESVSALGYADQR